MEVETRRVIQPELLPGQVLPAENRLPLQDQEQDRAW